MNTTYVIMCGDIELAIMESGGRAKVIVPDRMPFDLWLEEGEKVSFSDLNLYENHLDNAFVDISLRGKALTVENAHLIADDISTSGVFPKAWVRTEEGFCLYKDGDPENVKNEVLASRICKCFDCNQVLYEAGMYDGESVSISDIMTSLDESIVTRAAFDIYAVNHDMNPTEALLELDAHGFYMMNILDYLVGNTDRHWENWGILVDNKTGRMLRLHDLMDFNQSFKAYDNIEGALCQTTLPRHISQKEAAMEAVKAIGLNQIKDVDLSIFDGREALREMFEKRLDILKNA